MPLAVQFLGIRSGMKKVNVDVSVLFSVATCPGNVERINNWISGISMDNPGIFPLGAMHPDTKGETIWMR